jgi:surface protein
MVKMFANVNQATSIKIDNFNTSKVTNMEKMFSDTKKLKTLDLSNFDTRRTTSMQQFFQNTYELESVTLGPLFTIENTKNVTKMFQNTGLTTVDISMFNTAKVNTFNNMFDGSKLQTIYVGTGFVTTGQTSNPTMFDGATSLVGGSGTTYSDKTKTYARIDDPDNGNPGYFTLKQ